MAFTVLLLIVSVGAAPTVAVPATTNISNTPAMSTTPSIGMGGPNLMILWKEWTPGPYAEVYFRRSADGGGTWQPAIPLSSNAPSYEANSYDWTFVGRYVHVVWSKEDCCSGTITYRRSVNAGASFNAVVPLWTGSRFTQPKVASSGGSNVYVVWSDYASVYFRRSANGGETFAPVQTLAGGGPTYHGVLAFGPHVYIWWEDFYGGEVYLRHSADGGATFGPTVNVSASAATSDEPDVAVGGPHVFMVYREAVGSTTDTFLKMSADGGATFGAAANLSNNPSTYSYYPRIVASGTILWVAWADQGSPAMLMRRSGNAGVTWGSAQTLSSGAPYDIAYQVVAIGGTRVHVGWQGGSYPTQDVYYRRSIDTGLSYNPAVNLSSNSGESSGLQLLAVGHDVFAVWSDNTPGNYEILLATAPGSGFAAAPMAGERGSGWADGAPNPSVPTSWCPPQGTAAGPPAPSPQPVGQTGSPGCRRR
ncbi:MAG TPA: sialidase family protein [bacterium]